MHLHFERNVTTKCDCTILSLSWMGKVPDDIPEDEGWKLNRTNYYQEGWLATGNIRGIVGVTFTTSHCRKNVEYPLRTNYNLRGHRSDVILVKWNEPYQKLASCDSSGIIFVWIKYEGRWSIELINDRNTPVTHFSWSHDGRMALICYQDGFVLVGSVAGQRYWSSMLNLESTITCGIWTPDDQQVYFGTTQGQIIVMDVHGAMVSQVQLCNDVGITAMSWSCEKFKMEEGEEAEPGVVNASKRTFVLAVSFQNGYIYLLKSFDDVSPAHINTGLNGSLGLVMEWSNSRELLAVAGTQNSEHTTVDTQGSPIFINILKFYTESGNLLYTTRIPNTTTAVSALTWGHNDKRLFIATGTQVHIAWVSRRVASLQLLCRLQIQASIGTELTLPLLPLPSRIKSLIGNLFAQTIRCCVPDLKCLREFVARPPICSTRLHCTMIRHDDDSNLSSGNCYTLYLEYLGGLVPLLKGKRTSKIRPEFVIFDPQIEDSSIYSHYSSDTKSSSGSGSHQSGTGFSGRTDSSDSEYEERFRGSPRTPRKRKTRSKKRNINAAETRVNGVESENLDELAYIDTLPEEVKLVEVTSNIWGTKFKIHGLAKTVPANLGQVTYKTSLLHLQPRQMTLVITELRDDYPPGPDPTFNPNVFSEDEDDSAPIDPNTDDKSETKFVGPRRLNDNSPPIAPMTPRPNRIVTKRRNSRPSTTAVGMSPLARAESYDDDSSNESLDSGSNNLASKNYSGAPSGTSSTNNSSKHIRPKHIDTSSFGNVIAGGRAGTSFSGFKTQNNRSSSNSSCQSRHAISPLCCEGSVPTLQSPKNAVAPSDIIFERPPASGQTTMMSYSSNNDYSNNVAHVKNALMPEMTRSPNSHVNPVPLNLNLNLERIDARIRERSVACSKKKDLLFIDEDSQSPVAPSAPSSMATELRMKRTPTVISIAPELPDSITRSCSVGYLDSVEIIPSDEALSALRKEAPNKRLILVDSKKTTRRRKNNNGYFRKPKLNQCGKSKSLDSCIILPSPNNEKSNTRNDKTLPKFKGISEGHPLDLNSEESDKGLKFKVVENCLEDIYSDSMLEEEDECVAKAITPQKNINNPKANRQLFDAFCQQQQKQQNRNGDSIKKKTEVLTSFTDSPLFTRKHRFGNRFHRNSKENETDSPSLRRKADNGFNFVKQLSEVRWKRKDTHANASSQAESTSGSNNNNNNNNNQVEATPVESKTSVSLHTQALTTLENIISRLRDLDEGRLTPPSSPQRLPRSSPASPAVSKKAKRYQSSSPIRNILNSPLLNRRQRKKQIIESSDDESNFTNASGEESVTYNKQYRDLETFQKAQLRQKLKRGKIEPNGSSACFSPAPLRREFVMHNKAPMWNEMSQVYQLDFGGRVTQESAKNFQIEFRGKQVMQFGRIDGNAYTLDFQYPFSAVQAFAVALANVTQRLK
ncbi:tubby-related protein 4 isoform X3 [Episyrphus balteatus]|uniref:tubby-related protein 4 isoform X3 n=1 Tax=Episyrphus balteatus TaxID=286459 RepID=UPI00248613B1|nr:tubby-related protein 4 isoform X3 [Episyrphus balteatus]